MGNIQRGKLVDTEALKAFKNQYKRPASTTKYVYEKPKEYEFVATEDTYAESGGIPYKIYNLKLYTLPTSPIRFLENCHIRTVICEEKEWKPKNFDYFIVRKDEIGSSFTNETPNNNLGDGRNLYMYRDAPKINDFVGNNIDRPYYFIIYYNGEWFGPSQSTKGTNLYYDSIWPAPDPTSSRYPGFWRERFNDFDPNLVRP